MHWWGIQFCVVRPIHNDERTILVDLLCEGFKKPRSFWSDGLERIVRLGGNAVAGVPLGYVLSDNGQPVGVVLTPASVRLTPAGAQATVVNLSSWYVAPRHRWRAPVMLQSILRAHDAMFTDLTATPEVRKINEALGFETVNRGLIVTPLPAVALARSGGATVRELDARAALELPADIGPFLLRHKDIGCLPAVIETPNRLLPLLFRSTWRKGLPMAHLLYCESNSALAEYLPAVARFLVARGMVIMVGDDRGQRLRLGQVRRPYGLKLARPGGGLSVAPDRVDYAGSELCCLAF